MDLKAQRAEALKGARDIASLALGEGRDLTEDEQAKVKGFIDSVSELDGKIKAQAEGVELLKRLDGLTPKDHKAEDRGEKSAPARSLGEHFAKSVSADELLRLKSTPGLSVSVPEFKAATDSQATPEPFKIPVLQDVDTQIIRGYRRPLVTDLFGTGTISGTSIRYFIEGAVEGAPTSVAEGGQKPQLHIADPTAVVDQLGKIAAWFDMDDEMTEDLDFWVSELNNRALYLLSVEEENQILNGDGTGSNLKGVLNRDGLQSATYANGGLADAIFNAGTLIQNSTGLSADGVIINPSDYQALRLQRDSNQQYYGGGFFQGQYGTSGLAWQQPIWGLPTVVSPVVAAGAPVVGNFKQAATVYRKGGVKVDATNSDQGKFTKDIVTTRIEERIALAVRIPSAIVKLSLAAGK